MQEELAVFSSIEERADGEYIVTFSETQSLERLKKKLLKANLFLNASVKMVSGYTNHFRKVQSSTSDLDYKATRGIESICVQMHLVKERFQNHILGIQILLQLAEGVSTLVILLQ